MSTWVKSNVYADFWSLNSASVIFIFVLLHVYIKPLLAAAAAPPPQGGVLCHHVEVRRIQKRKKNGDEIKFIFDSKIHMCSRHKIFDYHRSWLDGGNTPVGLLRKATKCLVLFGSLVSPVTS